MNEKPGTPLNPIPVEAPKRPLHGGHAATVPDFFKTDPDTAQRLVEMLGGTKHDQGKPPMELLDRVWLEQTANVLAFGAQKYARHNWRKGIQISRLIGAAMRHIIAFNDGEDTDPESGLPHLAHASCCLMFAMRTSRDRSDLDDRYKPGA